jgi:hypothetical protein
MDRPASTPQQLLKKMDASVKQRQKVMIQRIYDLIQQKDKQYNEFAAKYVTFSGSGV